MIGKRRMEWGNDTWVLKIDGPNPSFHGQKSRMKRFHGVEKEKTEREDRVNEQGSGLVKYRALAARSVAPWSSAKAWLQPAWRQASATSDSTIAT
jgi:hypothetical protein